MRHNRLVFAVLLLVGCATATYGQQDVEKLIEKSDPAIQAQIQKLLTTLQTSSDDPRGNLDVCREVQTLKQLSADKDELVKQLAIFVATKSPEETQKSPEETHVLILNEMLHVLDFPPRVPIRVLAPYLDTDNRQLRDSVRLWFNFHDAAHTGPPGAPPIKPVNYEDYLEYVEWKVTHKEDVPPPFIKYIFERSPGRALLVFAYAHSQGDITTRLPDIGDALQRKKAERREIELAEHIVSNAIWLNENEFAERFQAALPEANESLATLAKHKEWWARLYVAYIMGQHPELKQADVIQQLSADSNALVSKAANSIKQN